MASIEEQEPPLSSTPSFTIQPQQQQDHNNYFSRSISHKESSYFETPNYITPRLSLSSQYIFSQPPASSTPTKNHHDFPGPIYRCISSVLKKDGQILCIAVSNGLVYTGCQSNVIRIWKLSEFMECGQLKTKACMAVSIHVSNDKVYAAYADSKIRVWHRTWEGAIKHVRIVGIPRPGNYDVLRSYITGGRDKTVIN